MTDGFLNILKPPGMSSHDVVYAVRRALGVRRVGHAGTLDPGAAGVLPVAVGKATKLLAYLEPVGKTYRAELLFGIKTDSGDDTGKVLERMDGFSLPSRERITEALASFKGRIEQRPPKYSAIKINGQKAYMLARQQLDIELPAREVEIYRLELLAEREQANTLLLEIDCSKGTYIRSLCADIGDSLGIPATMSFLVRTRVGDFRLFEAITLEELAAQGAAALLAPDGFLKHLPRYDLPERRRQAFLNGLPTGLRDFPADEDVLLRVYSTGDFLGLGHYDAKDNELQPEKIFYSS